MWKNRGGGSFKLLIELFLSFFFLTPQFSLTKKFAISKTPPHSHFFYNELHVSPVFFLAKRFLVLNDEDL